jgi:hypothetical protein
MKHILKPLAIVAMSAALMTAFQCENENHEPINSYNAHHTGCLIHATKVLEQDETVEYSYADGVLHVIHHGMTVNCGTAAEEGIIDVAVIRSNETTIDIYETENENNAQANCICEVDNEFDIHGLEHGSYTLVFHSWNTAPEPHSVTITI